MNVHDYIIDHSGLDWAYLLSGWEWLLPAEFSVWLMNRYGDLFLILPDGQYPHDGHRRWLAHQDGREQG